MWQKLQNVQTLISVGLLIGGGGFYAFNIVSAVNANSKERKEFRQMYQRDKQENNRRYFQNQRRLDRLEIILERIEKRLPRRQ